MEDLVLARQDFRWLSGGVGSGGGDEETAANAPAASVAAAAAAAANAEEGRGRGAKRKREESDGGGSEKTAGDFQRKMDEIERLAAGGVLTAASAELAKGKLVTEFVSMV